MEQSAGGAWLAGSMAEPLTLMAVHAHPDDEASGGGILASYSDQGIQTIVVTCTNGEYGDAPGGIKPGQPGHDPEAVARLRLAELEKSASILKLSDVETLGYHDSGMPDWEYKTRPEAFSRPSASSATLRPRSRSSHSRSPGSVLPARVAITSPSSGVKPIVVSTLRPRSTAASEAPAPR